MNKVTTDKERALYVIKCYNGYSCLGFMVCCEKTKMLKAELDSIGDVLQPPIPEYGTIEAYNYYQALIERARVINANTGYRFSCELSDQLKGLEKRRVEVVDTEGLKYRFNVGVSTGFIPCHLEIHNKRSTGGPAARKYYRSVTVVR